MKPSFNTRLSPTGRIGLFLVIAFLIPTLFYSAYEISSLNDEEKMIEEIYQKQLEAILFSVNQISNATTSNWATKLETERNRSGRNAVMSDGMRNFLSLSAPVFMAFEVDTLSWHGILSTFSLDSLAAAKLRPSLQAALEKSREQINQLLKYKRSGFQKLENLGDTNFPTHNFQTLMFISEDMDARRRVSGLVIDPQSFVENVVGPLLQQTVKEQFVITVFNKATKTRVYSTQLGDTTSIPSLSLTRDLWIFPNYAFGIRTTGASLEFLARERTRANLLLLLGLDVLIIASLVISYRTMRKEVQLAQRKSDFVSSVSHELRTPLALITMFAETLEMGRAKSEEKKNEYYSIISKEAHRLSAIVNKILTFSQTEAGKKKIQLESIDLNSIIKEVLHSYDFHLHKNGFEYQFSAGSPVIVVADKDALAEIMVNLLDNAIKYSADRKRIEISVGIDNLQGWLAVKDYGIGISKEDQKYIFDKFYRVSAGNLAKTKGTGIGLSLVKQLVLHQKGEVYVSSELGKGSTFRIYFPLYKPI
ncbi:MAG TPA: HAMP domain-containing sensor histidine kinase [Cyclobacteriaceae bacterium]|jgi:two-component system phosphate regulon sensor histidine kinase PhoR|nr:HAMP domain-containing sensor histidine kinase [Cyclobacteriaceae bacterium]